MRAGCQMSTTTPRPWPLRTHLELAALSSAVPCARGHVRSVALEWGLPGLADTAELLASELVTNAIQASERLTALETPVVRLGLASDGISIVIHVGDASGGMPVRREAAPAEEGGRGLMIIAALSADWGSYLTEIGKVVWALVAGDH
jgi:hypothetical protein